MPPCSTFLPGLRGATRTAEASCLCGMGGEGVICQGLGPGAMSRVSRVIICQGLRGNNIARSTTTCQPNLFMEVVHWGEGLGIL